ncbi:helix-turn-helix transcriptional regulator [Rhizobiales bacterium L72]|uniref:Helix-turn-helix transcriptional regulator n=1 Tax=Propylenella binzhouense TaxID=2555902 RepID=A0A964T952_9HYPH|nr:helix-turn-helix transcriptional regulator [Propylenella binzhouense]
MWTHESVWRAIDALAAEHGLSASGLARKAGLDPTAFNRSKRLGADGRPRWPSTESIAKILEATGASLDDLMRLVAGRFAAQGATKGAAFEPRRPPPEARPLPLLGFARAGAGGFFDDGGYPAGQGWDEVPFPAVRDESAYALSVTGDSMLPVYRDGDTIIVSPTAEIRSGDRVVVRTAEGEVMAKVLKRKTTRVIELESLNPEHPSRTVPLRDVAWIARILWASQ